MDWLRDRYWLWWQGPRLNRRYRQPITSNPSRALCIRTWVSHDYDDMPELLRAAAWWIEHNSPRIRVEGFQTGSDDRVLWLELFYEEPMP